MQTATDDPNENNKVLSNFRWVVESSELSPEQNIVADLALHVFI